MDWGPLGKDVDYGSGRLDAYGAVEAAKATAGSGLPMGLPDHVCLQDSLPGTGNNDYWTYDVATTGFPIAVTLVMPDWTSGFFSATPDFDLYLYDPSGVLLASSTGTTRQETISISLTRTGTYKVRVYSYSGSGNYFFDMSAGLGDSIDNPPTVSIQDPKTGDTISGTYRVKVSASDDRGVIKVELRIDGGAYIDITNSYDSVNYWYDWDTRTVPDGTRILDAKATDNGGLSAGSSQVTVTVNNAQPTTHVENITMALRMRGGSTRAEATVTILDGNGRPVSDAAVSGVWSGLVSGPTVGVTDAKGRVTLKSSYVRNAPKGGAFTFTVAAVVKVGWGYDSEANKETSDSTVVP